ncbi:MAG TPA: acetyl-CoA acetyltransferase [Acidimicrobiia bacterium]|nr:acetyl-CoA acetyltransferase [Acidimicrobiia bacterium]
MDPRTPVLAGVGVAQQRVDDPDVAVEAIELMASACERAAPASLLAAAQSIAVPRGTWRYHDPGRLLADRFGADAHTVVGEIGVLQQTLVTRACATIAAGDLDVALVVGGEAKYRDLRARIAGTRARETEPTTAAPDERLAPEAEIVPRIEIAAGLTIPAAQYAVVETAWRASRGLGVEEHRQELARWWAGWSEIAAANPDAWRRDPVTPDFLARPSAENPMYCSPYTRWHCSQWNVDQAAALLVCSWEAARRHRVDPDALLFPVAAVESNSTVPLSRRAALHRAPAVAAGAERLAELAGVHPRDADALDLYSCFPSAVQVQAAELGLGPDRVGTVTGGMAFAGGPLDNYTFQSLAKMAEVLRSAPGTIGLVTCISGMITKHGMALWSARPAAAGFRVADVSDAASRRTTVLDLAPDHDGAARIDGCSVVHARDGTPERALVVATTDEGRRCVAASVDPSIARDMVDEEWVGRRVRVEGTAFR